MIPVFASQSRPTARIVSYLEGSYRGQVNSEIQDSYEGLARYEELADPQYIDTGGIFDIMAGDGDSEPFDGRVMTCPKVSTTFLPMTAHARSCYAKGRPH